MITESVDVLVQAHANLIQETMPLVGNQILQFVCVQLPVNNVFALMLYCSQILSVFSSCNSYYFFQSNVSEPKMLTGPGFLRRGCLNYWAHTFRNGFLTGHCFSFGSSERSGRITYRQPFIPETAGQDKHISSNGCLLVSDTAHGPGRHVPIRHPVYRNCVSKPLFCCKAAYLLCSLCNFGN